jgi:hypothetical protein
MKPWLLKVLGLEWVLNPDGISLHPPAWKVSPIQDFPIFLRALQFIFSQEAILYLEGGYPDKELSAFLEQHTVENPVKVAVGTIWPRPNIFHIRMTPAHIETLSKLTENRASPEVAIHLHVYKQDQVLLEWHDAFFDDPMFISKQIPEEKVKRFCDELHVDYRETSDLGKSG